MTNRFSILLFALFIIHPEAKNLFVSTAGSNSVSYANNDLTHPWLTLDHGIYNVKKGDTLNIRGGTYTPAYPSHPGSDYARQHGSGWFPNDAGDPNETVNCESGTAAQPIVFQNCGSEKVTVNCTQVHPAFIHLQSRNYWIWRNMEFTNAAIVFFVGQNTAANNCSFENLTIGMSEGGDNWGGITLVGSNAEYAVIRNCKVTGPGLGSGGVHLNTAGVYLKALNHVKLLSNEFSNAPLGIYYKHANTPGAGVDIEIAFNYFHDLDRNAMQLNCNNAVVHDNVFGKNSADVTVNEANGVPGGDRNTIAHNTFFNCGISLNGDTQSGDPLPGAIGNTLRNNLFTTRIALHQYTALAHSTASDYNLHPSGNAFIENRITYTLSAWQAHAGTNAHSLTGSPLFIGGNSPTTLSGFALSSGSPGKGKASDGKDMGADLGGFSTPLEHRTRRTGAGLTLFPNPFSSATQITFDGAGDGALTLYDITGKTLFKWETKGGVETRVWNGLDRQGFPAPAGAYVLSLRAGTKILRQKALLIR